MSNCVQNNLKNIAIIVSDLFDEGGDAMYESILAEITNNYELDDSSQYLSYLIDAESITDPDINRDMRIFHEKILRLGTDLGYNASALNTGFKKNAAMIMDRTKVALSPVSIQENEEYHNNPEDIALTSTIYEGMDSSGIMSYDIPVTSLINEIGAGKVKSMTKVQDTYFTGKLITKVKVLSNTFKKLISRSWLSTISDKNLSNNFDFEVVKEDMKNDAYSIIYKYYEKSADATSMYEGDEGIGKLLIFTDVNRIPGDVTELFTTEDGTRFYSAKYVKDAIFVLIAPINIDTDLNLNKQIASSEDGNIVQIGDVDITGTFRLAPEQKPKRVSSLTAEEDLNNETLLTAYAAHAIINEFNTFVRYEAEELSSMFKESYRDGHAEVDIAGTSMETKFIKLAILSTPKIHATSNNAQTLDKLKSITTNLSRNTASPIQQLSNSGLIKILDGNGNQAFNTTINGVSSTNIVVNVGVANVVFSYTDINRNGHISTEWVVNFPTAEDASKRKDYPNTVFLKNNRTSKISTALSSGITEVLTLLNSDNKDQQIVLSKANITAANLSPLQGQDFINSTNSLYTLYANENTFNISTFEGNSEERFIDPSHVKASAGLLADLSLDIDEAGEQLYAASLELGPHANIARALYYKFFHKGEYKITEVSPITGLLETTVHHSIYEKAMKDGDQVAWDTIISLLSQLTSTVLDNKVYLANNYMIKSSIENANNIDYLIKGINTQAHDEVLGLSGIPNGVISKYFSVNNDSKFPVVKYYQNGITPGAIPTTTFSIQNDGVEILSGDLSFPVIKSMLTLLKAPEALRNSDLYHSMKLVLSKDKTNPEADLNFFYGKLIGLRLANVIDDTAKHKFNLNYKYTQGQKFSFGFIDNLGKFKDTLTTALGTTFSRTFSSVYEGPTGTKFSNTIYKNLSKEKKAYIKSLLKKGPLEAVHMLKNSGMLKDGGIYVVLDELTRLGLKIGETGKDTKNLTQQELLVVLVNSFIQYANLTKFTSGLSGEATMADRSKIDMFVVALKNGESVAPIKSVDGVDFLDENKLKTRFFDTQQRSFSAMSDHITGVWSDVFTAIQLGKLKIKSEVPIKPADISKIRSMRDVYNLLKKYRLNYEDVLQYSGLVDQFSVVKNGDFATLNYSMIQLSEVVLNPTPVEGMVYKNKTEEAKLKENAAKKQYYLDMYYAEFIQYTEDNEYEISPREINILENKFSFLKGLDHNEKTIEAKKLALQIFFYNDSVFEQELIQFGMGTVFQYKTKVKSLFEKIHSENPSFLKSTTEPSAILEKIQNYDFGKGINTKMTYDQLESYGIEGNTASSIKSIIDSEGLSDKDKVAIIEYLDTFSQISPMYVDRVKRNAASGTSGLGPILATTHKAGMYLDEYTKGIMVEDPTKPAFTLNSGFETIETFNGSQQITSEYAYKLNNSLGNNFCNLTSTSVFKTVNPAKTKHGVAMYEKLAAFSQQTWEIMMVGGAEHASLHEWMMAKEKFSDPKYGLDYDGLYLFKKEDIKNPNGAAFVNTLQGATIPEQIQQLKKHGEYLGTLKLVIQSGTGNITESVTAAYLLYALNKGTIKESDIISIHTNKVFVDSSKINSKSDLFHYYGGIKTNLEIFKSYTDPIQKDAFLKKFPFGWVEYQVAEIMSNYSGSLHNYPIRNASINKISFVTTVKTGRHGVNPSSTMSSKDLDTDEAPIIITEVSNKFLRVILKAEKGSDASVEFDTNKSDENSSVALVTQVISSASAEGSTKFEVGLLNKALGHLSDLQLKQFGEEIASFKQLVSELGEETAEKQYMVNLLRKQFAVRKGANGDILGISSEDAAKVSLDLKMLHEIMRVSINAEYATRGIKLRFPGSKSIISPQNGQIKLYNFGPVKGLMRNSVNSDNNINGLLKKEITAKGFNGILSDINWKLKAITSLQQLKNEHAAMDYVYKVTDEIVNIDGQDVKEFKYEPVLVQDLFFATKEDLVGYVSPWMSIKSIKPKLTVNGTQSRLKGDTETWQNDGNGKNNGSDGNDLSWITYYKDGKSMQETDEFISTFLAGKAPKDLINLIDKSNAGKLEYFQNELFTETPAVPKLLWARFILNSKSNLTRYPELISSRILPQAVIDEIYTSFTSALIDTINGKTLLSDFFTYIESFAGNERPLTNMMKSQLSFILEQDGWTTEPAEFFTPPPHQAAYLLEFGDAIADAVGIQEQPNLYKMASIVGLNAKQISLLERNYVHARDNVDVIAIKNKILENGSPEALKYLDLRMRQQAHMKIFFGKKISNVKIAISESSKKDIKKVLLKVPILVLENAAKTLDTSEGNANFKALIDSLLTSNKISSNIELFTLINDIKTLFDVGNIPKIHTVLNSAANLFTSVWRTSMANNFEKSLTFVTARIPVKAKQDSALGKVKGFIYSSKNIIHSPLELIVLSGGDYDYDAQTSITWNVDSLGKIVSWDHITNEDGTLDISREIEKINGEAGLLRDLLLGKGYETAQAESKSIEFKRIGMVQLKKSTENYVLNQLMLIEGSSKNAIESSTSVLMKKLGVIKDYIASFNFSDLEIHKYKLTVDKVTGKIVPSKELLELIKKRQIAIPYTPSTKMLYEKINMDGKSGISAYASAIKAYMAIFNATINNDSTEQFEKAVFSMVNTKLTDSERNSPNKDVDSLYAEVNTNLTNKELSHIEFGITDGKYPTIIWRDPITGLYSEGKELIYPANTEKFIPKVKNKDVYPLLQTSLAKKAYLELQHVRGDAEQEAAIVLKYKDSLDKAGEYAMEPQAWQDLAELLSASTDNAKELILSAIGATNTTNSLIATMIIMGIDLQHALLLINDPIIKKIVKTHEREMSLIVSNKKDFTKTFKTKLIDAIGKYDQTANVLELEKQILIAYPKYTKVEIQQELMKQQELYARYNPTAQLSKFVKASEEFSNLSGLLTVNTRMANSSLETFNYLMKLERALKLKGSGYASKSEDFTLKDFLESPEKVLKIIEHADENRVAFNVPYIIYKNKPFYAYIKALYESNEMMKRESYTADILDTTIKTRLKEVGKLRITEQEHYAYSDVLANFALSSYYAETNNNDLQINTLKENYDLSDVQDRSNFVHNIEKIKESLIAENPKELSNIQLLKDLQATNIRINKDTGKSTRLLAGIAVAVLSEDEINAYKADLKNIQRVSPVLFNVLFQYSLIVNKGGLSKTSIASLFDSIHIMPFMEHLLKLHTTGRMKAEISGMKQELLGIILPVTLKELSTLQLVQNKEYLRKKKSEGSDNYADREVFNAEYEESMQAGENEDEIGDALEHMDEVAFERYVIESALSKKYDVTDVNALIKNNVYAIDKTFISKTNGLTYSYFESNDKKFQSYVPITKNIDSIVGNISNTSNASSLEHIGYGYGWGIKLRDGEDARLLAHISAQEENSGNTASTQYFILKNGKVELMLASDILASNPQFYLYGRAILVRKGNFKSIQDSAISWTTDKDGNHTRAKNVSGVSNMLIGSHMSYYNGDSLMNNAIKIPEKMVASIHTSDESSFDAFTREGDIIYEDVDKMFATILTNISMTHRNNNKLPTHLTLIDIFDDNLKLLKDPTMTENSEDHMNIVEFRNDLLVETNKHKFYVFLRSTDAEKLAIINSKLTKDTTLTSLYTNNEQLKEISQIERINQALNPNSPMKSDIDFLMIKDLSDISIKDYLTILHRVGISPEQYRESLRDKMDLLVVDDAIYVTPNYREKNLAYTSVKSSITLDTRLSPKKEKDKVILSSPKVISRLSMFLNKRFENSTIKVMTVSDIEEQYPELNILDNEEAFVNVGNKTIILIKNRVTLDTLLHEMSHLYLSELKDKNMDLYEELMHKMENDPLLPEIKRKYADKINYTIEDILEEAFVFKIQEIHSTSFASTFEAEAQEYFDGILDVGTKSLGNVTNTMSVLFEDFFGGKFKEEISMTDTLSTVMTKIGADLIFNSNSSLHGMNKEYIKNIKNILRNKNMTETEAIKQLVDEGFMTKDCK